LRDQCGLTGTHLGCEHGVCGACTVIVDGDPVRACLMFAVQADGAAVETIEGLTESGALADLQATDPAAPALPLIVNRKTVDPRDPASTPVIQLESAMGAAIGSIPGARAVHVPRSRFAPVKTTDDLLVVRSDAYELTDDGQLWPGFAGPAPVVTLDPQFYELLPDFEQRFPAGAPSLRRCRRFEVDGDVTFGAGVTAVGDVRVAGPRHVPDGQVLGG